MLPGHNLTLFTGNVARLQLDVSWFGSVAMSRDIGCWFGSVAWYWWCFQVKLAISCWLVLPGHGMTLVDWWHCQVTTWHWLLIGGVARSQLAISCRLVVLPGTAWCWFVIGGVARLQAELEEAQRAAQARMEEELERARREAELELNQQRSGYEDKLANLEKTLVA